MAHFLEMIHRKAADKAALGEEETEETDKNIPEEKLRDEDLVGWIHVNSQAVLV